MTPRVKWCSDAQALAYKNRLDRVSDTEIFALIGDALRFPDRRPLEAACVFCAHARANPEGSCDELLNFIMGWLDTRAEQASFDWQDRSDCGV